MTKLDTPHKETAPRETAPDEAAPAKTAPRSRYAALEPARGAQKAVGEFRGLCAVSETGEAEGRLLLASAGRPVHLRPGRAERVRRYVSFTRFRDEPEPDTKGIYLYLRRSKFHGEMADSIERQRVDLIAMLEAEGGWTVLGEFIDNDSSRGQARGRHGYPALMAGVEEGWVGALAWLNVDRLDRNAWRLLQALATFRERRVEMRTLKDSKEELEGKKAEAKMMIGIKALFAEAYSDAVSEKVADKKRHAADAGFNHGGQVPFGWELGPKVTDEHGRIGTRLVEHPIEFPALQAAVRMALEGHSLSTITRHFVDEFGIVASDGKPIRAANLLRALRSPRLLGYRMRNVPEHQRGVKINLWDFVHRDPRTGEYVISQPPVVSSRAEFDRLQRALDSRSNVSSREPWGAHEWLLSGVARCGECGEGLYGRTGTDRYGKRYIYGCMTNRLRGKSTCPGVSINAPKLEAYVTGWLHERLSDEAAQTMARQVSSARDGDERARVDDQLAELRAKASSLAEQLGTVGPATVAVLAAELDRVHAQMAAKEAELAELVGADQPALDAVVAWEGLSLAQRRAVVARLVREVQVAKTPRQAKFDTSRISIVAR